MSRLLYDDESTSSSGTDDHIAFAETVARGSPDIPETPNPMRAESSEELDAQERAARRERARRVLFDGTGTDDDDDEEDTEDMAEFEEPRTPQIDPARADTPPAEPPGRSWGVFWSSSIGQEVGGNDLKTLATLLSDDANLSAVLRLAQRAGVADVFADESAELTLFAPNNEALQALPTETIDALLANADLLRATLLAHVVVDSVSEAQLRDQNAVITTAYGTPLAKNSVRIVDTKEASNGRLYVIDTVLPVDAPAGGDAARGTTVAAALRAEPKASLVFALAGAAGLAEPLSDTRRQLTVFAPVDSGVRAIGDREIDRLLRDQARARTVVLRHVVDGRVERASIANGGKTLNALSGDSLRVGLNALGQPVVGVEGSSAPRVRIIASRRTDNGIIHYVSGVIMNGASAGAEEEEQSPEEVRAEADAAERNAEEAEIAAERAAAEAAIAEAELEAAEERLEEERRQAEREQQDTTAAEEQLRRAREAAERAKEEAEETRRRLEEARRAEDRAEEKEEEILEEVELETERERIRAEEEEREVEAERIKLEEERIAIEKERRRLEEERIRLEKVQNEQEEKRLQSRQQRSSGAQQRARTGAAGIEPQPTDEDDGGQSWYTETKDEPQAAPALPESVQPAAPEAEPEPVQDENPPLVTNWGQVAAGHAIPNERRGRDQRNGDDDRMPVLAILGTSTLLGTLDSLITRSGLKDTLRGQGPFTVFAPTDEAFQRLPAGALDQISDRPNELRSILLHHVVLDNVKVEDLLNGNKQLRTAANTTLRVRGSDNMISIDEQAYVLGEDDRAYNGNVIFINGILYPRTAMQQTRSMLAASNPFNAKRRQTKKKIQSTILAGTRSRTAVAAPLPAKKESAQHIDGISFPTATAGKRYKDARKTIAKYLKHDNAIEDFVNDKRGPQALLNEVDLLARGAHKDSALFARSPESSKERRELNVALHSLHHSLQTAQMPLIAAPEFEVTATSGSTLSAADILVRRELAVVRFMVGRYRGQIVLENEAFVALDEVAGEILNFAIDNNVLDGKNQSGVRAWRETIVESSQITVEKMGECISGVAAVIQPELVVYYAPPRVAGNLIEGRGGGMASDNLMRAEDANQLQLLPLLGKLFGDEETARVWWERIEEAEEVVCTTLRNSGESAAFQDAVNALLTVAAQAGLLIDARMAARVEGTFTFDYSDLYSDQYEVEYDEDVCPPEPLCPPEPVCKPLCPPKPVCPPKPACPTKPFVCRVVQRVCTPFILSSAFAPAGCAVCGGSKKKKEDPEEVAAAPAQEVDTLEKWPKIEKKKKKKNYWKKSKSSFRAAGDCYDEDGDGDADYLVVDPAPLRSSFGSLAAHLSTIEDVRERRALARAIGAGIIARTQVGDGPDNLHIFGRLLSDMLEAVFVSMSGQRCPSPALIALMERINSIAQDLANVTVGAQASEEQRQQLLQQLAQINRDQASQPASAVAVRDQFTSIIFTGPWVGTGTAKFELVDRYGQQFVPSDICQPEAFIDMLAGLLSAVAASLSLIDAIEANFLVGAWDALAQTTAAGVAASVKITATSVRAARAGAVTVAPVVAPPAAVVVDEAEDFNSLFE